MSQPEGRERAALLEGVGAELVEALLAGDCADPHAVLGAHADDRGGLCLRAHHPDAQAASLLLEGREVPMTPLGGGLFAACLPGRGFPAPIYEVRFSFADGQSLRRVDPYRFPPTLGDLDLYLAGEGRHLRLYEKLGAHPREVDGVAGVSFSVWAPNARRVSLVGQFNGWDGRQLPMRRMGASGIWELFVPGVERGALYKFEVKTAEGHLRVKTDPFAFAMELRPGTASVVQGLGDYAWGDAGWMEARRQRDLRRNPMAIYEVHLGSWMRAPDQGNRWLGYRELAPRLVDHLRSHGFNFVELLPVAEYAYDPSWGYQVTGYYAPTCRFGGPDDLRFLIDSLHQAGIGVVMDWVPGHFPKDDWALRRFDGTALYEHEDPRLGEHMDWGTLIFNYGRHEVRNFLLSNALYWLDRFHIDGLRVDAVASMLYLDYSRKPGEWLPNKFGGRENLAAIDFLREFNREVYANFPGAFTVAEESTAFAGVTRPVHLGGLGFGFKWDMGWMNDSLRYFRKDPVHRKFHHNDLTFGLLYAYTETFILPLSHDEVAQGKGSLYDKMPGDHWQRLANLRLLLAYQFTHPGKKLLFMGAEFGQGREWNFDRSLDWHEAAEPERSGLQRFARDLGQLYQRERALWARECDPEGFFWIDCNDSDTGVLSFGRWGDGEELVVVMNVTPVVRRNYRVGVPRPGRWRELLNSDASAYGGSNVGNGGQIETQWARCHGHLQSLELTLPPLGALILKPA
ncbi:MAG TPA: 1,4-alpha-glucan branching protein GlgB [Myxococcota bacterium]|nr:1,4-alpha-glucan branching protein GlgB [Myxococcota bacterium]HRY95635.1 1,4-alpha-glucan branching protein GlgB [Myxococcota bacterium]